MAAGHDPRAGWRPTARFSLKPLTLGFPWKRSRGASANDNRIETALAAITDPAAVEFFEKQVRPILSARCQGCHGPAKQKGGLRLDARETALAGGSTGPAVVPGKPNESLLVDAINYGETYHMPPKSKLPPEEIATLTEWVQRGAPWGPGRAHENRIRRRRQDSRRAVERRIPARVRASGAFSRCRTRRPPS